MQADRMILGENVVFSTDCNVTGVNNNVIVCGGSGSGKTMSISEPCLLEKFNSSLIATVTKRRIVKKYRSMFKKRGYHVLDLNFAEPAESNIAYDPLVYVKTPQDVKFLASSIVLANPRKEKATSLDPYWDDSAVSLMSALIEGTRMLRKEATFADVLTMLDVLSIKENGGQIQTTLDSVFSHLTKQSPDCFAVNCWKTFRQLPVKTASCVYSTLHTAVDTIFSPELREMIAKKRNIDFKRLASEKTVLFITTSAVNTAMHYFVNMFYAQAFKEMFEFAESRPDGKLPVPVHVLCDDFATGSRILNFPEYISIFREKQISVTLLIQSESQLESMYGQNDATTIINNCDTYIYLGGMDLNTARSVSVRLNAPLDEVLYMPIGQEIVFHRGQRPIITKRYNILENELYRKITEQYERDVEYER